MTTSGMDANTSLLDQTYFELDAKSFAAFEHILVDPPAPTSCLRRTLGGAAPWEAPGAQIGKAKQDDRAAS